MVITREYKFETVVLVFVSNRIVNGIECLTCEGNLDSDCKIAQNVQIHQCDQDWFRLND